MHTKEYSSILKKSELIHLKKTGKLPVHISSKKQLWCEIRQKQQPQLNVTRYRYLWL